MFKYFLIGNLIFVSPSFAMRGDWRPYYRSKRIDWSQEDPYYRSTCKILTEQGNIYSKPPTGRHDCLAAHLVTNTPYWRMLRIGFADQAKKNKAFDDLINLYFSSDEWSIERYHLAAAAHIGAKSQLDEALGKAAKHNDYKLCELLLSKGANPNGSRYGRFGVPFLHLVKTLRLARLFFRNDADIHITPANSNKTVLHRICKSAEYNPKLIPFYLKKQVSPLQQDKSGNSVLHYLARFINDTDIMGIGGDKLLLQKAQYLLEVLSPEQKLALLYRCGKNNTTVFEDLEKIEKSLEQESKKPTNLPFSLDFIVGANLHFKKEACDCLKAYLLNQREQAVKAIGKPIWCHGYTDPETKKRFFEIHVCENNEKFGLKIDDIYDARLSKESTKILRQTISRIL